jgi:hypothetical protein
VASRSIPAQALRAALSKARRIARRRGDVLSVGLGVKHSRARGGFGDGVPCVKFVVKTKSADVVDPLPASLGVVVEGRRHVVLTDVDEMRAPVQQTLRCLASDGSISSLVGTLGFLFADAAGRRHAVTAGHVVFSKRRASPWPNDVSFLVGPTAADALIVGQTIENATYVFRAASGGGEVLQDLAAARLYDFADLAPLRKSPWDLDLTVAGNDVLARIARPDEFGLTTCRVYGGESEPRLFTAESVHRDPVSFPDLGLVYAPILVKYRAVERPTEEGDSGAAVVTSDGRRALAVHVVGDGDVGWGIAALSVQEFLDERLGGTHRPARP